MARVSQTASTGSTQAQTSNTNAGTSAAGSATSSTTGNASGATDGQGQGQGTTQGTNPEAAPKTPQRIRPVNVRTECRVIGSANYREAIKEFADQMGGPAEVLGALIAQFGLPVGTMRIDSIKAVANALDPETLKTLHTFNPNVPTHPGQDALNS